MSGECDDCGEHCLDCKCESMLKKDQIEMLEEAIYSIQKKIANPDFEKYVERLNHVDSKINQLFEKLEDNCRRLNNMMLEFKGAISMSRSRLSKNIDKET